MTQPPRLTGPEAIEEALKRINLDELEAEQRDLIRAKKKTARPRAVRLLRVVEGLRKNSLSPADLMVRSVPVIPPQFRPFSVMGDTYVPGDANELYRDIVEYRKLYDRTEKTLGRDAAGQVYADLRDAVKAAYGYGESPNPKVRGRGVKGFFEVVTGTNPKTSFYNSKMLAKPVDMVGRAVIVPDPDLTMDETGIPEDMAWDLFGQYTMRRLVHGGMSPPAALKHVKERTPSARKALDQEVLERPIVVTRAPAWHRYNVVGQRAKITDGSAVRINTQISEGLNADFDGDTVSVHLPSTPEAIKDVKEKMMASKMLWSIKDRGKTLGNPKHEMIVGAYESGNLPSKKTHQFKTESEALKAIENQEVDLSDEIKIG